MRPMPSSEDILSIKGENIASFIQKQADARMLSAVVKRLNADLMTGDRTASQMAARALHHLGFVDSV